MQSAVPPSPLPATGSWRLVAIDVDGTLIGKNHQVNPEDRAALARARRAGLQVALCTGRVSAECFGVVEALELSGPGVFANGATLNEMATLRSFDRAHLPFELVEKAVRVLGDLGHSVLLLEDELDTGHSRYWHTAHGPTHRGTIEWLEANGLGAHPIASLDPFRESHVIRAGVVVDAHETPSVMEALHSTLGEDVTYHFLHSPGYDCDVIEIFQKGVDKWTGLERLCARLNIPTDSVVAIGDDKNDIPMLERAALSFAMGNARPAIQAVAKHVTASQKECGVAQVIDGILDGRWSSPL